MRLGSKQQQVRERGASGLTTKSSKNLRAKSFVQMSTFDVDLEPTGNQEPLQQVKVVASPKFMANSTLNKMDPVKAKRIFFFFWLGFSHPFVVRAPISKMLAPV